MIAVTADQDWLNLTAARRREREFALFSLFLEKAIAFFVYSAACRTGAGTAPSGIS